MLKGCTEEVGLHPYNRYGGVEGNIRKYKINSESKERPEPCRWEHEHRRVFVYSKRLNGLH